MTKCDHPKYLGLGALYSIFWTMLIAVLLLTAWLSLSTHVFIRPVAIHYDGRDVTFVRETPYGSVWGKWNTEIRVVKHGFECNSGTHDAEYQQVDADDENGIAKDTVQYKLGPWATPCLERGVPLVIINTWTVKLWDLIPLRSARLTTIIDTK